MSDLSIENLFSVAGQVVVITGGGTGLGKVLATTFSTNGAKVYITGRRLQVIQDTAKEINALSTSKGEVIAIQGDVSSKASVKEWVGKIVEKEEKVDTLINCAGVLKGFNKTISHPDAVDELEAFLDSVNDEDFTNTNSVNISGPYFTTTALLPLLRKSSSPNVINIASIAAFSLGRKVGSLTYGVSKAGTVFLSSQLAGRLSPFKIRVNCICPGIFPSEMTALRPEDLPDATKHALTTIPLKRMGQPQEIAGPALLLASKAGGYMHNALLVVDGGRLLTISIDN